MMPGVTIPILLFQATQDSVPENDRLYARELYNLNLDADMVVLSACESGLGQLKTWGRNYRFSSRLCICRSTQYGDISVECK